MFMRYFKNVNIMRCFIAFIALIAFTELYGMTLKIILSRYGQEATREMIRQKIEKISILLLIVAITSLIIVIMYHSTINDIHRKIVAKPIGIAISGSDTEIITPELSIKTMNVNRIHEAGHAVMAYLQGFQVIECITFATPEQAPYTRYDTPDNPATIEQYENIILVCYAGAVSEILVNGKLSTGCIGMDGKSDFEMAEKLIRNLLLIQDNEFGYTTGGEAFENAVREKSKELFDKTMEILSKHQKLIEKLVKALEDKNSLSGEEVSIILEDALKKNAEKV